MNRRTPTATVIALTASRTLALLLAAAVVVGGLLVLLPTRVEAAPALALLSSAAGSITSAL